MAVLTGEAVLASLSADTSSRCSLTVEWEYCRYRGVEGNSIDGNSSDNQSGIPMVR